MRKWTLITAWYSGKVNSRPYVRLRKIYYDVTSLNRGVFSTLAVKMPKSELSKCKCRINPRRLNGAGGRCHNTARHMAQGSVIRLHPASSLDWSDNSGRAANREADQRTSGGHFANCARSKRHHGRCGLHLDSIVPAAVATVTVPAIPAC